MKKYISKQTREELLRSVRQRYSRAVRIDKSKILDEFVAVAGCHRKYAIKLLGAAENTEEVVMRTQVVGNRIYNEAIKEALIVVWEASDRICGKRLKAVLPEFVEAMERHGHMCLDPEVRSQLLSVSASTIDRILAPIRRKAKGRRKRRVTKKTSKKVSVRTFADWDEPAPGYLEVDFVAHCGGSMSGRFIHSLAVTDVCTGWIEAVPLLAREQSVVVEGLELIGHQFPVPIVGIDTDNDGAFINETLINYCSERGVEFTRSRPYQKNDQAWIEQKNGSVIRRFVGYDRYSGLVAGQTLAHLYNVVRLYVNYFQPSFKLLEKIRIGAKIKKRYDKPTTPCDRLLTHRVVHHDTKRALIEQRSQLDPLELLHRIRQAQSALASLSSSDPETIEREELDQFLNALPHLWRAGEARPTHRQQSTKTRYWRTRTDPFEGAWLQILEWLQNEPDATAKSLFERLRVSAPEKYVDGQLRTLQRRIKDWRNIMAKNLVLGCGDITDGIRPLGNSVAVANHGNISE
jgi:hypothetical protein